MQREKCPCCGFLTLQERRSYEICALCDWEDDGQGDSNANEIFGGPNWDYSLIEARRNFKENLTMYREFTQYDNEMEAKKSLIDAFIELGKCGIDNEYYEDYNDRAKLWINYLDNPIATDVELKIDLTDNEKYLGNSYSKSRFTLKFLV